MNDYITVCTKSQLRWLNVPHWPSLPPPVTVKQRVLKFLISLMKG